MFWREMGWQQVVVAAALGVVVLGIALVALVREERLLAAGLAPAVIAARGGETCGRRRRNTGTDTTTNDSTMEEADGGRRADGDVTWFIQVRARESLDSAYCRLASSFSRRSGSFGPHQVLLGSFR